MTSTKENRKKPNGRSIIHNESQSPPMRLKHFLYILSMALLCSLATMQGRGLEGIAGATLMGTLLLWILYRDIVRYQPIYSKKTRMLILIGLMVVLTLSTSSLFEYLLSAVTRGL